MHRLASYTLNPTLMLGNITMLQLLISLPRMRMTLFIRFLNLTSPESSEDGVRKLRNNGFKLRSQTSVLPLTVSCPCAYCILSNAENNHSCDAINTFDNVSYSIFYESIYDVDYICICTHG